MQFNTQADEQDIVSDITFLLGGIGVTEYTLKSRARAVNERFRMIWQAIFESYGGWQFMDDNTSDVSTGVPYTDQTITSGTGLYALPSAALTIKNVAVKPTSTSVLMNLVPLSPEEFYNLGGDAAFPSNGVPLYYILQGDIIRLLPIPNFTLSTALRIYFDQDISIFLSTDTSKVPGFASPFHRMLSIGAALDFAIARNMRDKAVQLQVLWNDYEKRLKAFYSKRYLDRFPHRIGTGEDLVDEYS
jgi:hypothetical protein